MVEGWSGGGKAQATLDQPPGWGLCTSILTSLSLLFHLSYPSYPKVQKRKQRTLVLTEGSRGSGGTYWGADFPAGEKIRGASVRTGEPEVTQAPNLICLGKVEASGEAGPRVVGTHLAHAGGRDFSSR